MISAAPVLHTAAVARLRADPEGGLAAAGIVTTTGDRAMTAERRISTKFGQDPPLPYVLLNLNTETTAVFAATTSGPSVGTDNAFGGTVWHTSYGRALALAAACVEALSEAEITAAGFEFRAVPDAFLGPPYEEAATEGTAGAWGCPFRVRFRVHRTV